MKISILGCGWLGLPLAKSLVERGHLVKGSNTTVEKLTVLRQADIQPFALRLAPEPQGVGWSYFLEADVLIINIPPRLERSEPGFHVAQMQVLANLLQNAAVQRVLYVSSTSVYPELNRVVFESDVTTPAQSAAPALVEAEQIVQNLAMPSLVLRCGGLMGYERIPAKYVSGKQNLETGNIPVNYVHRDDVIGVITHFLEQPTTAWNRVYNVVAPEHPIRRQVYETTAAPFGYLPPTFLESAPSQSFKIVSSQSLLQSTSYAFCYPNPITFYYNL